MEYFAYGGALYVNRINEIRKKQKITQVELSKITGIAQSELSQIINEKKTVNIETAKKISKALGYSIEYIWPD